MEKIAMNFKLGQVQVGTRSHIQQPQPIAPSHRALDDPPETIRYLVRLGCRAFPCFIGEGIDGVRKCAARATSTIEVLEQWSSRIVGESDWGIVQDADSGIFLIEVHGIAGVAALRNRNSELCTYQETLTARLRAKVFMFFKCPENKKMKIGQIAPGLRVLYPDDFVVIPSTLLQEGPSAFFLDPDASVIPAPGWLLQEEAPGPPLNSNSDITLGASCPPSTGDGTRAMGAASNICIRDHPVLFQFWLDRCWKGRFHEEKNLEPLGGEIAFHSVTELCAFIERGGGISGTGMMALYKLAMRENRGAIVLHLTQKQFLSLLVMRKRSF